MNSITKCTYEKAYVEKWAVVITASKYIKYEHFDFLAFFFTEKSFLQLLPHDMNAA